MDRQARDKLAGLLMHYRNGEIAGEAVVSGAPDTTDSAVLAILREYSVMLRGEWHYGRLDPKRVASRTTELPDCVRIQRMTDRAMLFLSTDLEYRWRDYSFWADPTLSIFQAMAFLIALPLLSWGCLTVADATVGTAESVVHIALCVLMVLLLTAITFVGGARLRSLFTGIDRYVWPFYRRRDYRDARRRAEIQEPR